MGQRDPPPELPPLGCRPALDNLTLAEDILRQNGLCLSFPYVCPEPVLAKSSFLYINGSKRPLFHLDQRNQRRLLVLLLELALQLEGQRKLLQRAGKIPCAHLFSELSLCLVRACVGKMIIFSIKMAQNDRAVFAPACILLLPLCR